MSQYYEQGDEPDFLILRQTTGRVIVGRRCTRCGRTMPPGTAYWQTAYKQDGVFKYDQECVPLGDDWRCPLEEKQP